MTSEEQKRLVGYAAAERIQSGSIVGIGTGSTVHFFIERLIKRVAEGLSIHAVSSSLDSMKKAQDGGIPILDIETVDEITTTVDGADEIDPEWNMIKGGGGALFREKLLAVHSKEMFVIVDASKRVSQLGKHPLPLEILPFFHTATIHTLHGMGYDGTLRKDPSGKTYVTDNGNYIYDIRNKTPITTPIQEHERLITIPGVLETGLFFHVAKALFYPDSQGNVVVEER